MRGKFNLAGKTFFFILLGTALILISAFQNQHRISYFQSSTVGMKPSSIDEYTINFKDSIPSNILYQISSEEGYPISYYRKVSTGICFDNKCRLLDIVLYWNITGRYLGFELPEGEFLSKTDHKPFVKKEYERLHEILSDTQSPLGNYTYDQLVTGPPQSNTWIDAVSSATAPAVLEHTVAGAVYTTYTLWHTIHGTTQDEIQKKTISQLTPELVMQIIESPDPNDSMWILNNIRNEMEITPPLMEKLLQLINKSNYSISERSINIFDSEDLASEKLQLLLLDKFHKVDYSLKKLIIDQLKAAPELSLKVTIRMVQNLENFNVEIVSRILDLIQEHQVSDPRVLQKVVGLLDKENAYISKKAYKFLKISGSNDKKVEQELLNYEAKRATQ